MRVFNALAIYFYAAVLALVGAGLIVVSLNMIDSQSVAFLIDYTQASVNTRLVVGLCGLLVIVISYSFAQMILGRMEREKTIAFKNPQGVVTISLSAIEDLIKQFTQIMPELKELRPDVIASKKGIVVKLRVALRSEANLPELTARLQEITKSKIQEVLGVEEQIIIRIHISKIISHEERERKRREFNKEEPSIPFGGFGRV